MAMQSQHAAQQISHTSGLGTRHTASLTKVGVSTNNTQDWPTAHMHAYTHAVTPAEAECWPLTRNTSQTMQQQRQKAADSSSTVGWSRLHQPRLQRPASCLPTASLARLCCLAGCLLLQGLGIPLLPLCCCQAILVLGLHARPVLPLLCPLAIDLTLVSPRHPGLNGRDPLCRWNAVKFFPFAAFFDDYGVL